MVLAEGKKKTKKKGGAEEDDEEAEAAAAAASLRLEDYAHSPAHYYVATNDTPRLSALLAALPRLCPPSRVRTPAEAAAQERLADRISAVVDRRDVPRRETPLHLAVRLDRRAAASALASAGADTSLQDAAGWTPLQESVLLRRPRRLALLLLRHHHLCAWHKWRRRLPFLLAALRRVRDFYLELSFHFESSVVPFLPRVAPSDTYRVWKRGASVRADTSLAGFDGLRVVRADQSFLFLGGADEDGGGALPLEPDPATDALPLTPGSLLVLNHSRKEIYDAFQAASSPMTAAEEEEFVADTSMYRPGLDITSAELVGRTNWRRREKTETVGEWKARVYEVHNVVFSFKTRRAAAPGEADRPAGLPLELDLDDDEDGFLVADIPDLAPSRHSCYAGQLGRSDPDDDDELWGFACGASAGGTGRRSVDVAAVQGRRRWDTKPGGAASAMAGRRKGGGIEPAGGLGGGTGTSAAASAAWKKEVGRGKGAAKEKEVVKSLRPWVWLTEEFPLRAEDVVPVLDVLAGKVKAVRRLRELLTAKFPPGTFPVKVAIPVVPTVRVVITFTKFVALPPLELFFTPLSSPRQFSNVENEELKKRDRHLQDPWHRWNAYSSSKNTTARLKSVSPSPLAVDLPDPFTIPSDYSWTSIDAKTERMKRTKSMKGK
uniref:Ankyrin repeat domain-containing protein 13B n=1 Tax=Anthurium amnicola TaxID=1678845 RepID=A0A1D1YM80_9ARAE